VASVVDHELKEIKMSDAMKMIRLLLCLTFLQASNSTIASADDSPHLRLALSEPVSFDPLTAKTLDSKRVHELVYQRLLSYDSGSSEIRLQTELAASMPKSINSGLAFDVEIGTARFVPAQSSTLRARAVRANDVVHSFQRMLKECDANIAACSLLRTHIKSIEVRAKQTVRFHLHAADFDFPYLLAMPITAVLAPEGVAHREFFGSQKLHVKSQTEDLLILRRNNATLASADTSLGVPIRELHFRIIKDKQTQLQQFLNGELDFIDQLGALERQHLRNASLSPELTQARAHLNLIPEPEIIYYYLSPNDPTFGGHTPAQIALRRAVLMSYSVPNEIVNIRAGLGQVNASVLPPELPEQQKPGTAAFGFDPLAANAELDTHGFARGPDGWRRMSNREMLTLSFTSEPLVGVEPYREARRAQLAALGIRMNSELDSYSNNLQRARACKAAFWGALWSAEVPTPGYMLSVLRSDRIGTDNLTCYSNAEFDQLHRQAQRTPSGPERAALYQRLTEMIQRDAIWQMGARR
jgi:oligopeptide transport system substrate-binding protein